MSSRPHLITFDIFGTVLDWRIGLANSCLAAGRPLDDSDFARVVDWQAELERGQFQNYATITSRSLVDVLGLEGPRPLPSVPRSVAGLSTTMPKCSDLS